VHCETLNTIPSALLEERLATLAPATMLAVDGALTHSLGLD
jgi:mRNA-degrading endonuclease toxin of MazEF toxin-antitoxin module